MKTPEHKLQFEVDQWEDGQKILRHCSWCQPITDPEVKRDIEDLSAAFRLKVTSGMCENCFKKQEDD